MTLPSPFSSFMDSQLPPFDDLPTKFGLNTAPRTPPTITPKRPASRRTHPLPHNFAMLTTPGVQPEQVTVSSEPLGRGSFGSVWRGTFSGCPVAIKLCPLDHPSNTAVTQFRREMSRYHHLRHPCITQFFCVVQHSGNLLLVTELMKGGSLYHALSKLRAANLKRLRPTSMLRIAQHVTNGLAYLHASGFSFGDLKSMNVLLSDKPNISNGSFSQSTQAKLCDFGLSRNLKHLVTPEHKYSVFDTQIPARHGPAGTFAYLAPEAFSGLPVDDAHAPKAADIYALAIVLWEIATLRSPWPGKQPLQLIRIVRKEARRPSWPADTSGIPDGFIAIVERCWHQDASQRPTADTVAKELDTMLRALPDHIDPAQSFHERGSFFSRTTDEALDGSLSSDLGAMHVEDHLRSEDSSDSSEGDDDDSEKGLATIKHVKSIRILSLSGLRASPSEMSTVTTTPFARTSSQSAISIDSYAPSAEARSTDVLRCTEQSAEQLRIKERRMSLISSESGPDSRRLEPCLVQETPVHAPTLRNPEYKVPTQPANDTKHIDKELQFFEEEEDLDVRRLGISMHSRPHFR